MFKLNIIKGFLAIGLAFPFVYGFSQSSNKPNILFILSDDHSAPFLGVYGDSNLKTPNLDKLAKEGILFNKAFTTAPQCTPSRASLISGRSQLEIGVTRFASPFPAEIKTFPDYLKATGYYTGLAGRNYHLDGVVRNKETKEIFEKYKLETFKSRVDYAKIATSLEEIHNQYTEFLNQVPKDKPFFLQLNFSDPHRDFDAKEFEPDPTKLILPNYFPDTKLVREDLAAYYGEIQRLDISVGKVLEELKKRGLENNTLVIFIGDNGGALLRGKGTLHRLGINVPLIAKFPGTIKPGQVSNALVSGIDIAPTVLQIAGLEVPKEITGKSLLPAFQGKPYDGHAYVFAVRSAHGESLPTNSSHFDLGRTVFNQKYKLIYNALWQLPYTPVDFALKPFWIDLTQLHDDGRLEEKWDKLLFSKTRPLFELYNLESDPEEFNNLSGKAEYAQIERELKTKLQEWMILNRDYIPLPLEQDGRR